MKTLLGLMMALCGLAALAPPAARAGAKPAGKSVEGDWEGVLGIETRLRLFVRFTKNPDGSFSGSLDSPDQEAKNIRVDQPSLKDGAVRFELRRFSVVFEGKLKEGELAGRWKQGKSDLPLTLTRQGKKGKKGGTGLEGEWRGTLTSERKVRLLAHFTKQKDGTLGGTLDSPDQGATGLRMDEVTLKGESLRFTIKGVSASYEGKLKKDGSEVAGRWKQGKVDEPLTFTRQGKKGARSEEVPHKRLGGYWLGKLDAGAIQLRVGVKFTRKKDGTLGGTMDSIDQGVKGLPLDTVTLKEREVRFAIKVVGGAFEGKLKEDGSEIVGMWKQAGESLPLTLKRLEKEPTLARPQEPKKPYPYVEEEVTYENKKAGVKFAGTLTLPKGKGPFAAVLLITGSGPQDRNEALMGHKPFLVLADHLTRRGIAVLRVDDRGVGGSTGNTMKSTTADFADDALAGVEFLKTRAEIGSKRIGLLGHSEGGVVAPLAASKSKDVAFIVLLAGTAVVGEEILYEQGQLILKTSGADAKQLAKQRRLQELMFRIVKEEKDDSAIEKRIKKAWDEEVARLTDEEKKQAAKQFAKQEALLKGQVKALLSPWFRYFLTHDPALALRQVECPVLALFAEKDLQVIPRQNLPPMAKALAEGKCRDYTITQFPGLNHLFQTCKTGLPTEYGNIEETMTPRVLEAISSWILQQTKK
ncbi:MAG: alpha/beta fold hydrolase [Gemmataceae bacterium]|nr:alpha/beta fold hydrolase [Gemmataceae bacterium]